MALNPLQHEENLKKAERAAFLIAGHVNGSLTPAEQEELDDWITESDANLELFEKLTDEDNIEAGLQKYLRIETEKAAALTSVKRSIGATKPRRMRMLWPYMAAASVLVIVVVCFFLLQQKSSTLPAEKPIAQRTTSSAIARGSDKAVLTLSDGRTIILDSSGTGLLASDGTVQIEWGKDGELVYGGATETMRYNTVATPRGSQYQITLGDGTQVWLNADSYLKFPAGMATGERSVVLRGEGFFKVAKDAERLFTVRILNGEENAGSVEVLGTHFNVNGYADEGVVKTTLVEGSVRISHNGESKLLEPGEQALLKNRIQVVKADVPEETAWREGKFLFRDASIKSIGEQIRRWYDVDVQYEGSNGQLFNTEVNRTVPLQQLLDGLAGTGQVHFVLKRRTLILKP